MHLRTSTLLSLAFGALLIAAPGLDSAGDSLSYDQAFAAKGGNGKGNGGNGKGGASNRGGNSASAKGGDTTSDDTSLASTGKGKQKTSAKELALSDPLAPAHPSMLGRWNAAKPIDHPAVQAHIRNGNYNGTIGMVAAYANAQSTYNSMEADLAAAQAMLDGTDAVALQTALDSALLTAGYNTVADYELAGIPDPAVDAALQAMADYEAAADVVEAGEQALADLAAAEANMEAYSNRAPWSDIRDDVRAKMGLDPAENDLVSEDPAEATSEPAPITELAP
jgi:hypothetical protein